jgi:hypothetical protein
MNDTDRKRPTVFLDTEVFIQHNFQYDTGILATFREQVRRHKLDFIISDVTLDEIRRHISEAVEKALAALRTFRNQARILRASGAPQLSRLFKPVSQRRVLRDHLNQFERYLQDLSPIVVSADAVEPSAVFSRYFKGLPPFHDSPKKAEFPDAFAIEALRVHCLSNKVRLVVVSGDKDWAAIIEPGTPIRLLRKA